MRAILLKEFSDQDTPGFVFTDISLINVPVLVGQTSYLLPLLRSFLSLDALTKINRTTKFVVRIQQQKEPGDD